MSETALAIASYAFLPLVLLAVLLLRDNLKVQLLTVDALSLVLLGLPPFFSRWSLLPSDIVNVFVLTVYPSVLTFMRLKSADAFNRAMTSIITLTALLLILDACFTPCLGWVFVKSLGFFMYVFSSGYFLYLLILAVPEFLAVLTGDAILAARGIVAYESFLGLLIFSGLLFIGIIDLGFSIFFDPWTMFFVTIVAVAMVLMAWSLRYVLTHEGSSAKPSSLLKFHLLDNLFIGGFVIISLVLLSVSRF